MCRRFLMLLVVVYIGLFSSTTQVHAATPICSDPGLTISETECEALATFYDATYGYQWYTSTNWLTSADVDTWYGVEVTSGHVTALELDSNRLLGAVPSVIGDFTHMKRLSLENNFLVSVHTNIAQATHLEYLNVSWNNIGTVPSALSQLAGLEILHLEHNNLSVLPNIFTGMQQLETLYLQHNNLTSLPSSIGTLGVLDVLDVSFNVLTDLPDVLTQLSLLAVLDIEGNQLTQLPSTLGNLGSLQLLYAQDNALTTLPASMANLGNLYYLALQKNAFTELPSVITQLAQLQYLRADENAISVLPASFSELTKLVTIYLNNNQLTTLPVGIETISPLRYVYLQDNQITGRLPDTYAQLTDLHRIYLFGNQLDRESDPEYEVLLSPVLEVWKNNLVSAGKQVLLQQQEDVTLPVLQATDVPSGWYASGTDLTISWEENSFAVNAQGSGLSLVVSGSTVCDTLILSTNTLTTQTGSIPIQLSGLGVYDRCDLHLVDHAGNMSLPVSIENIVFGSDLYTYCQLEEFTTPTSIPKTECEALVSLYLVTSGEQWTSSKNWFETTNAELWHGVRTTTIAGQKHVDGLFLHKSTGSDTDGFFSSWNGNNLIGTLPPELANLTHLQHMNLSKNTLGLFPDHIGTISSLKNLILVDSNMFGVLPASLEDLDTLELLNIQTNPLSGTLDVVKNMNALSVLLASHTNISGSLPVSLTTNTQLKDIRLESTSISGELPDELGSLTLLEKLYVGNTNLHGSLPASFANIDTMQHLSVEYSYFDRTPQHIVDIDPVLDTWILGLQLVKLGGQKDDTAPIISSTAVLPDIATGTMQYTINIEENSYAVSPANEGMIVSITGNEICSTLSASSVLLASGSTGIDLTPVATGGYIDCMLEVIDHGGNTSNTITLPSFVFGVGNETVCWRNELNIPFTECIALVDFYESLSGDGRLNTTNWLTSPDVQTWQGLTLTNGVVTAIDMGGAQANNLSGTLPDVFGDLPDLLRIHLADNAITGTLPTSIYTLDAVTHLDISNNSLGGSLDTNIGNLETLKELDISKNTFSGTFPTTIGNLNVLEILDIHENDFSGSLPQGLSGATSLKYLSMSNNSLSGVLPTSWSALTDVEHLDIAGNGITGELPESWGVLTGLKKIYLQENALSGELPATYDNLTNLEILDLSTNEFVGILPPSWNVLSSLSEVFVDENNLDRTIDPLHEAYIESGSQLEIWWNTLSVSQRDKQGDISVPILTTTTTIPSTITESFYFTLSYDENSYAVNSEGDGMEISFSGSVLCQDLVVDQTDIKSSSGSTVLTISPYIGGIYNCFLQVRDHGDNIGSVYMGPFEFDTTCGNGVIDDGESCDEGKFCDDMTPCTTDPNICPGQCRPRLVDTCNPSCEASRCGDGYVDGDGIDNIAGNYDDETCDERSYCDDGRDCTRDPSICGGGYGACKARLIHDCNEFCTAGSCGDGTLDVNGNDNILGTPDDEECDDGNPYNGDGCSTSCRGEYCGDGYVDPNGGDNITSTSDDESCDLGSSNGILGGVCSSTCEVPNSECVYCYEICDGGTGTNSMFLLMDISGSMNNNSRLQNAKSGAINFVDLVMSGASVNTGFVTKIGVIAFNDTSTTLIDPTIDYTYVKNSIEGLSAGGGTNFGDPIRDAIDFFETYDTSFEQHIILLSDGEPTVSSNNSFSAGERALYQSNNAKARGINVYTIAVDQTDEGLTYMSYISSSTLINRAWQGPSMNKPVSQSSTQGNASTYAAQNAVDSLTQGNNFSLTDEEYQARWEINLNESILIDQIHVWNRTSDTSETSDIYVHVSDQSFSNQTLDQILANPYITSYPITGEVARPTSLALNGLQGTYVRVQLSQEGPEIYSERETFTSTDPGGANNNYSNNQYDVTTYCPTNPAHKLSIRFDSFNTERYYDFLRIYNGNSTSATLLANLHGDILPAPVTSTSTDGCLTLAFDSDYSVTKPGWTATLDNGAGPEMFTSIDPGGATSNYGNNEVVTNTYCPSDPSDRLTLSFNSFHTEQYYDFLRVYNGTSTSAGLLGELHGNYIPEPISSTHSNGCLTLRFTSDYSVTKPGWNATLSNIVGNTVNLGLSEVQIIGCSASDPDCTDVFHYQDFGGMSIEVLYGHIFGSIHCGCRPEQVCGICGDGLVEPIKGEVCDEGSYCDDLTTNCTADNSICAAGGLGECRPRFINGCTDTCVAYRCGDGQVNQTSEVCDDGNTMPGDGCNSLCEVESCGDGYADNDGADNIWGTLDDETCDDGNNIDGDGCGAACLFESCGDGFTDLDGSDNDLLTLPDNEQCDTGRTCTSTGEDCSSNPSICPGECRVSYIGLCTIGCKAGTCGDAHVQSGSLVVGSEIIVLSEACDLGMFCEDNFTPCTNTPHFCSLLGIGGGTCAPRTIGNCTPQCTINICGDGYVSPGEQCDDGNAIDGDGCTATCISETCGDGILDADGPDGLWNTLDDEICDDGNEISDDGCTSCKLDSCGDGILDVGEECDTINTQQCALPYCRLTRCGDGNRQWPNGQQDGGANGYEACDGTVGCMTDCSYAPGTAFCGDGNIQGSGNNQGIVELCDDGILNGQIGYCALDCQEQPTCGNGIVSGSEQCDDGNIENGDGCTSTCILDAPLQAPVTLSGSCIESILPIINPGELLPLWRQLETSSSIDPQGNNCATMTPGTWIQGESLVCSFSVMRGSIYGAQDTGVDITGNCLETLHTNSALLSDAIIDTLGISPIYPILGSLIGDTTAINTLQEQQGQYTLVLDHIDMTYCAHMGSGVVQERTASVFDTVCSLDMGVTPSYMTQDGAIFQEIESSSLDVFVNMSGSTLFTVGTALDEEMQHKKSSSYQGTEIQFITQDFIAGYTDKATQEQLGIWGVPIYKVPNERIYVYPGSTDLTLDFLEIQELVEDISLPFTLIIEDANLSIENSFGSENTGMLGMFVVNGEISFLTTRCDDTQFVQGIWIANDGFTTTNTKNTDSENTQWCSGGNLVVQGMLIGAGIDTLSESRRGVLQPWDTNQVYLNYAEDTLFSNKARELFDICYFPALLGGEQTTLEGPTGVFCNHTNSKEFIEQAKSIVAPYVQEWYAINTGEVCQEPSLCATSLPGFSCIYDDSPCSEQVQFSCGNEMYACTVGASENGFELDDYKILGCEATNTLSGCELIEKECTIDIATNKIECIERCSQGPNITCPMPLSKGRHEATQDMIIQGYSTPSVSLPGLEMLRNAFVSFMPVETILSQVGNGLSLTSTDSIWLSNTAHKETVDAEIEQRRNTISDGSSLYIEAAPELWENLPPGSTEMLESVTYLEK